MHARSVRLPLNDRALGVVVVDLVVSGSIRFDIPVTFSQVSPLRSTPEHECQHPQSVTPLRSAQNRRKGSSRTQSWRSSWSTSSVGLIRLMYLSSTGRHRF